MTVSFDGGGGIDTLRGPLADSTWNITGANSGTVTATGFSGITFTGVENLTGGLKNDTFVFSATGSLGGAINGGAGGSDTLDYSARTTGVTSIFGIALRQSTGGVSNIENIIGGSGADTLTGDANANVFTGGAGKDTITGGSGIDTIVETQNANFTLTNTSLTIGGEGNKDTLSSIEVARLTGGAAGITR